MMVITCSRAQWGGPSPSIPPAASVLLGSHEHAVHGAEREHVRELMTIWQPKVCIKLKGGNLDL